MEQELTIMLWVWDGLLCSGLIGLAVCCLVTNDLFKSIVLFIVFGIVMAITWARLNAPDIALVEAAIGAGLTGALLMSAIGEMGDGGSKPEGGRKA